MWMVKPVYDSLKDVPEPIDIVDVFRNSDYLEEIVDEAIAVGAKTVWAQLGVISKDARLKALAAGLNYAENCASAPNMSACLRAWLKGSLASVFMAKAAKTFYILHGDDDFGRDQELDTFRAKMNETPNGDLNTSEFEGENTNAYEVINAASSYPFLADKRLVIVKGMLAWITRKGAGETGKKAVEHLLEALPTLPDYARLVFVERVKLADSNKILKLARDAENGYEKSFTTTGRQYRLDCPARARGIRGGDRTSGGHCSGRGNGS